MTDDQPRDGDTADDAETGPQPEPDSPLDVDAEFARIVSAYGERSALEDPAPPSTLADRFRAHGWTPQAERTPEPEAAPESTGVPWDDEGHYVPPEPPPIELPEPRRLAAWFGVLGIPALTVLLSLVGMPPAGLLLFAFAIGFVGGFGYLVATMKRDDDRYGDDGAVV